MATTKIAIDETTYVLASSATDAIVQNISLSPVLYVFDTTLPAVGADAGVLKPGQAIQKATSLPVGNIYVRMANKGNGFVAVS